MKDYSLNEEERKNFVLNYDVTEEELTANMASGNSFTIPNTEANVSKLEEKMIDQVINSKEKREKLELSNIWNKVGIIGILIISTTLMIGTKETSLTLSFIKELTKGIGIGVVCSIPVMIKIAKNNKILKDIQKNRYFVKNSETINRGITNTNVLANSLVKENKEVTINDMDYGYSYNELKQIVTNTELQETFSFDTFPEEKQSKTKVRRR